MSDIQVRSLNEDVVGAKPGFLKRILWTLTSPGRLMEDLADKPRVLFWLFAVPIAVILPYIVRWPLYLDMLRRQIAASSDYMESLLGVEMTPELIEASVSQGSITGLLGMGINVLASSLIMALVFFAILKLIGGKGKYKAYLSVIVHSNIIIALYSLLLISISYLTGSLHETAPLTSMAALVSNDQTDPKIFALFSSIDVFKIWRYGIMAVGFTAVSKLKKKHVYIVTAVILIIGVIAGIVRATTAMQLLD